MKMRRQFAYAQKAKQAPATKAKKGKQRRAGKYRTALITKAVKAERLRVFEDGYRAFKFDGDNSNARQLAFWFKQEFAHEFNLFIGEDE